MRRLCRLQDLADGAARGFAAPPGSFAGLFVVRQGSIVHAYRNACPHLGVRLDQLPQRFLTQDGGRIRCGAHGAEFRIADGECLHGPCLGARLEELSVLVQNSWVMVAEDAGS